ncbi:VOC family protein [Candidatus Gracilibacteria bacterium]|jgi:predicted 3-demethylubiquinone-9 3-methyltransferase (glyoxalase superfamily)|nr:VOC family protein [Candidatus Gracilibacteria bacterium]
MLTTCLWSPDNKALEMAEFYTSIFPDSRITTTGLYDEANPHLPGSKKGDVMIVEFTLFGEDKFATLNGGPYFQHSCAASWMIPCANQDELDYYYEKLSVNPDAEMCGWVADQFGVSWQLIPVNFTEYMRNGTPEGKSKLMKATMEMKKLSWDAIETAYNG